MIAHDIARPEQRCRPFFLPNFIIRDTPRVAGIDFEEQGSSVRRGEGMQLDSNLDAFQIAVQLTWRRG